MSHRQSAYCTIIYQLSIQALLFNLLLVLQKALSYWLHAQSLITAMRKCNGHCFCSILFAYKIFTWGKF